MSSLPCQLATTPSEKWHEVHRGKIAPSLPSLHCPLAAGNNALISLGGTFMIQVAVMSSLSPELGTWPKLAIEIGSKIGLPKPDQ